MSGLFKGTHASVSCRPTSASGGGGARGSPAASLAARCYALSSPPSVPPARMHATLCPGGANHLSAPQLATPLFTPPSFTFRLPKCLISSSVECGSFREKSEGIINQGSHRRRHVTLGRGPACHQPVQTRHCWRSKGICTLMCFFRVAVSSKFISHWMQGGDFLSLASLQLINPDKIFCTSKLNSLN